jgi:hypothetical protein
VPVDLQVPVGIGREPVVLVAVEHNRARVRDTQPAHQLLEALLVDEVAFHRVLQVVAPVQLERAGDVPVVVQARVLVHLGHDYRRAVEVLGEPLCRDEDVLCVLGHQRSPGIRRWDASSTR